MSTVVVLACGAVTAVALASLVLLGKKKPLAELVFPLLYMVYTSRLGWHVHKSQLKKAQQAGFVPHSVRGIDASGRQEHALRGMARNSIAVEAVPMLSDNYAYLIIDAEQHYALAVDPCDPTAVQRAADELGVQIVGILTTHYHWDHAGGNHALVEAAKARGDTLVVIGSRETQEGNVASCVNRVVQDGELFQVGRLCISAVSTPGHTRTDMTYLLHHSLVEPTPAQELQAKVSDATSWSLFTGDVLFGGGCGKFFELPASRMFKSLQRIATLHAAPEAAMATLIWPGHEYTLENLRFAVEEEPSGELAARLEHVETLRLQRHSTVPSTLAEELETNLFLRCCSHSAADLSPEVAVARLKELRKKKNRFKAIATA